MSATSSLSSSTTNLTVALVVGIAIGSAVVWGIGISKNKNGTCGDDRINNEKKDDNNIHYKLIDLNPSYSKLIGNTPMVKLERLSNAIGCDVYAKMESMNPGGTGKDRVARSMLEEAQQHSNYRPGCDVVEGTSGSTGIALACLCRSLGLQLHVVMPDDQANEKRVLLEKLGAKVAIVPSCGIANSNHYVNSARRLAEELNGIFMNQFENLANYRVHYATTGPEIWQQRLGRIDAFVMSSGTGGTIAGVSRYLKEQNPNIKVVLADPKGSSLFNKVKHGVCFTEEQKERTIKKHRYDSIVEGVGLDRVTANFDKAAIDDARRVSDQDVLLMAHWMLKYEGLFIGSSSALNLVAAVQYSQELLRQQHQQSSERKQQRPVIVTVICDSGHRHLSRLWNPDYIASCREAGLYGELYWPTDLNHNSNINGSGDSIANRTRQDSLYVDRPPGLHEDSAKDA